MVEQSAFNRTVVGSSPSGPTIEYTSGAGRRLDSKPDRAGFDSSTACRGDTSRLYWESNMINHNVTSIEVVI